MGRKFSLTKFFGISLLFNITLCSEVPVFLWGGKSIQKLPYISAMKNYNEKEFQNNFVELLLKEKESLIVYIQDTLSLEDFITLKGEDKNFQYLKDAFNKEPSVLLPSVTNPSESLLKLNKNHKIKHFYLNESYIDDIAAAVGKNDIILLHSSDNEELNRNNVLNKLDNLMKKVQISLKNFKKSVTWLLTGNKSSWDKSSDESRITRHLLAVENEAANYTLLNFSECGLLYTKNVFLKLVYNSSSGEDELANSTTTLEAENADCKPNNKTVEFNIKLGTEKTGLKSAGLKLLFNDKRGEWYLEMATLSLSLQKEDVNEELNLSVSNIDAPQKFSYSCYKTIMTVHNKSDISGNITFQVFQVQPFKIEADNFAESFDCVTFFTIPIWMGFMVILLLTVVLAFGIYMLFNIHTMDRFDDPKGKLLAVPATD